jgi:hypothetical protein
MKTTIKPGDLVRRIIDPALGLAVVLKFTGDGYEILTDKGEIKWVFYDALELVEPVHAAPTVV